MKTYCGMFINKKKCTIYYEYFDYIDEVSKFLEENDDLDLVSLQRLWMK
jgi:hypothetical protein